jgi:hypothetical protein
VFFSRYELEFAGGEAGLHAGADLSVSGFAHPAPQRIAEESAFVGDCLSLEAALAGSRLRAVSNRRRRRNRFTLHLR